MTPREVYFRPRKQQLQRSGGKKRDGILEEAGRGSDFPELKDCGEGEGMRGYKQGPAETSFIGHGEEFRFCFRCNVEPLKAF